ncbi:MAG TPA: bacillithiol biosynthesis deacetylase BshB1 [Vicinamibacterales bacterium]|nr:bacillithiol biosynthesis deacetylase BshB1 [Vicinamibacterales bacterium]HPW19468.1 bacillithiol biosynthesis deacetylase BshB1 [Vicinamibacterales bacterium]
MTAPSPVDLLAFGPHPDDIEIGMAATIAKHASLGWRVGLCDLTRGELGSNGTPEERVAEGEAAAALLGAAWRLNLGLPDGALADTEPHVGAIVDLVRSARPAAIAVPYADDRHPDHRRAAALLESAIFKAGLRRYPASGAPWRASWACAYFINDSAPPSFVVDVSDVYDLKRRALACHASQFRPEAPDAASTRLTSPLFLQLVESRDAQFGAAAGVRYAEGFSVREPVVLPLLTDRWPGARRRR